MHDVEVVVDADFGVGEDGGGGRGGAFVLGFDEFVQFVQFAFGY